MRKIVGILLLSCFVAAASDDHNSSFYLFHIGCYNPVTVVPIALATHLAGNNCYSIAITADDAHHILKITAFTIATITLAKYVYTKWCPKKRRRYCLRCLCDLSLWDIVDRKKIVDPVDCIVCGIE